MDKLKKQIQQCDECGSESKELNEFEDKKWCPACWEEKTGICAKCGERFYCEDLIVFDEEFWCEDCLNDETVLCADCEERIYCDDVHYVGDNPICDSCYNNHYFHCSGCGNSYHNDDYGEDGSCCYCSEDNKPEAYPDNKRYYKQSRWDLSVGVEIEAEDGEYHDVYSDLADDGFGVQSDGSLSSSGIEIQVPASNSGNTYKLVRQACESLEANGFQVSKRCGLHIHVEYPSRLKKIKHLLLMIYACEPVFYAINPKSRQDNNFCQPLIKSFTVHEIFKTQPKEIDQLFYSKKHPDLTKTKIKNFKKSKWNECRYFGFNLHSLFYQKTVEFRYHAGTINPDKIMRWSNFLKTILLYVRFHYNQEQVLRLIEYPSVLGKIKYLTQILKLDEFLVSYLVKRYIKFRKQYVRNY